ncbi:MAG: four helix bundle protein [Myxococcota bacterium]
MGEFNGLIGCLRHRHPVARGIRRVRERCRRQRQRGRALTIEFAALAADLVQRFPRGHRTIADPLSRAAFSIPRNIAEGYGKRSEADRCRSYDIASGSAHECAAVLDVARILKVLDDGILVRGKQ